MISGHALLARADALAAITETPPALTRSYLTPEHKRASDLVLGWMRAAGMQAALDAAGNCAGRYEGAKPGLPCLMLGSHLDTVRDAGKYDGILGVLSAIDFLLWAQEQKASSRSLFSSHSLMRTSVMTTGVLLGDGVPQRGLGQ